MGEMYNDQQEYPDPRNARSLAGEAAIVIDPRLADLWQLVWTRPGDPDPDSVPLASLAAMLRLAYAQGYADAHAEEIRGELFAKLGLPPPRTRRAGTKRAPRTRRGRAPLGNSDR